MLIVLICMLNAITSNEVTALISAAESGHITMVGVVVLAITFDIQTISR